MPPSPQGSSNAAQPPAGGTPYPYRFGEVGVLLNTLVRDQVREALKLQADSRQKGERKKLGEIMAEQGWITQRQIVEILSAQRKYRAGSSPAREAVSAGANPAPPPQAPSSNPRAPAVGPAAAPARPGSGSRVPAAPAAPPAPKPAKQRIGHFELLKKLGEGAMGAVFQARDEQGDRIVALKILPKNLANDREFVERFKREVKTLSVLNHPNIVAYFGAGHSGGYWYYSMEFVEGESLSARLKREQRLPEAEALRIAREMARALAHSHGLSMIHRDIKPENILLAKDGRVKVTDFGLAKSQEDTQKLTAVGFSIGTPYYLSPEQALGAEHVDHRADLYSLGATLFHVLTGRVPFDHPSSAQVMVMHVRQPAPDPRSLVPTLSVGAGQLTLKLMAKEPQARFQSADEVVQAIEKVMSGQALEVGGATRQVTGLGKRVTRAGLLRRIKAGPQGCLNGAAMLVLTVALLAGGAAWLFGVWK